MIFLYDKEDDTQSIILFFFIIDISKQYRYNYIVVGTSARKEVYFMHYILSFLVAVAARLVGDCVGKWLNGHDKSDK